MRKPAELPKNAARLSRVRYVLGSQLDHLLDIPPEAFSVNQKLMQADTISVPERGMKTVFFQVHYLQFTLVPH
jgi:hypothetical protein